MKRLFRAATLIVLIAWLGVSGVRAQEAKIIPGTINEVEEQFRVAKLRNDVQMLERLLGDVFTETDQNGNRRTKAEMIELFRTFQFQSLTTDSLVIRVNLNTAVVTVHKPRLALLVRTGCYTRVFGSTAGTAGDLWRVHSLEIRNGRRLWSGSVPWPRSVANMRSERPHLLGYEPPKEVSGNSR